MADFVKLAATAKRLIEKNGREVRLVKKNRMASNPAQPWRGNDGAITTAQGGDSILAKVAFVPASGSGLGRLMLDQAGSLAVAFEQVGLVASDSIGDADLSAYDSILDGEELWKIEARGELKPAGKSLLWSLGLKR